MITARTAAVAAFVAAAVLAAGAAAGAAPAAAAPRWGPAFTFLKSAFFPGGIEIEPGSPVLAVDGRGTQYAMGVVGRTIAVRKRSAGGRLGPLEVIRAPRLFFRRDPGSGNTSSNVVTGPAIAADARGNAIATWSQSSRGVVTAYVARQAAGGRFSAARAFVRSKRTTFAAAAIGNGRSIVVADTLGGRGIVGVDRGDGAVSRTALPSGAASVAANDAGALAVAYVAQGTVAVRIAAPGRALGPPQTVAAAPDAAMPDVAVAADGSVAVSFIRKSCATCSDTDKFFRQQAIYAATKPAGAASFGPPVLLTPDGDIVGRPPSIVYQRTVPVVVWEKSEYADSTDAEPEPSDITGGVYTVDVPLSGAPSRPRFLGGSWPAFPQAAVDSRGVLVIGWTSSGWVSSRLAVRTPGDRYRIERPMPQDYKRCFGWTRVAAGGRGTIITAFNPCGGGVRSTRSWRARVRTP